MSADIGAHLRKINEVYLDDYRKEFPKGQADKLVRAHRPAAPTAPQRPPPPPASCRNQAVLPSGRVCVAERPLLAGSASASCRQSMPPHPNPTPLPPHSLLAGLVCLALP